MPALQTVQSTLVHFISIVSSKYNWALPQWSLHMYRWMGDNLLQVNSHKTSPSASCHETQTNYFIALSIGDCDIRPSPCGRNVGVVFDTEMSTDYQVRQACRTSYWRTLIQSEYGWQSKQQLAPYNYSLSIYEVNYRRTLFCIAAMHISKLQIIPNPIGGSLRWAGAHHTRIKEYAEDPTKYCTVTATILTSFKCIRWLRRLRRRRRGRCWWKHRVKLETIIKVATQQRLRNKW